MGVYKINAYLTDSVANLRFLHYIILYEQLNYSIKKGSLIL